jgi:hypothetical protein
VRRIWRKVMACITFYKLKNKRGTFLVTLCVSKRDKQSLTILYIVFVVRTSYFLCYFINGISNDGLVWNLHSPFFPFPSLLPKNINFKIFLLFSLFISHQHFFYYFLNKKLTTIQIFFFTFSYKLFQLYITSIIFFNH